MTSAALVTVRSSGSSVGVLLELWLTCTLTAGLEKLLSAKPSISFLAHADLFGTALSAGRVLAPARTAEQMSRIVLNDYLDAGLCALFIVVVVVVAAYGLLDILRALSNPRVTAIEMGAAGAVAGDD